jgi:hypothetical protein
MAVQKMHKNKEIGHSDWAIFSMNFMGYIYLTSIYVIDEFTGIKQRINRITYIHCFHIKRGKNDIIQFKIHAMINSPFTFPHEFSTISM